MERTWRPTTAGILNIISGAFFLIGGIAVATSGTMIATGVARYYLYSIGSSAAVTPSVVTGVIAVMATVLIVLGIVSLLGGVCALRRSVWGLALAGAIFTFFSLPPLAIPAITFLALSEKEFK